MSDKDKCSKGDWRLKQIALVAYAVATAVGMFYGSAYYDHFGITLLDYASPIDLLFIALANLKEVTLAALIVPLLFLCMVAVFLLGLFVFSLLVVAVPVVLGWLALSICALVVGSLAFAVAVVHVVALRAHWLRTALAAIRTDRQERAKRTRADADQEDVPKVAEEPLRLAAAYRQASQDVPAWKAIDPQTYIGIAHDPILASIDPVTKWGKKYFRAIWDRRRDVSEKIRDAYLSFDANEESGERRCRFKSWQSIDLGPRSVFVALILTLLGYLLYAASQFGTFYAEKLMSEAQEKGNGAESWSDFMDVVLAPLPLVQPQVQPQEQPQVDDSEDFVRLPRAVFVVPTENLASLDFSDCPGQTDRKRRLFSRANFRQDAGGDSWHGTPECLLRLGGVGRWQFLADIKKSTGRKHRVTAHTHPAGPRDPVILIVNNSDESIPSPEPQPETPAQTPLETPPQTPPQTPPETPAQTPPETPPQTPPQTPPETPAQTPPETPAQTPPETPPQTPPQTPPETPAQTPPETPAQTPPETPPQTPPQEDRPFVVIFDGRTGKVSTPECNFELVALIGPFPTGRAVLESNGGSDEETYECPVAGGQRKELERINSSGQNGTPAWQERIVQNPSEMVVLVGRADVRPINNSDFESNMKLATERAEWVRQALDRPNGIRILNITGGPADLAPDDNPCSRVVDVYMCSAD